MAPQKVDDPAQLLSWLDENQREDRRQLAELQQLAAAQARKLEDFQDRFQELEQQLSERQTDSDRFDDVETRIEAVKDELFRVVDERLTRLRETDSQLESGLDTQASRLVRVTKSIESLQHSITALDNRVDTVPPRLEDQARHLADVAGRFQELDQQVEHTQAQLGRFDEIESRLDAVKQELFSVVDERVTRVNQTHAQLQSSVEAQASRLVHVTKSIEALQASITTLDNQVDTLPPRLEMQAEQVAELSRDIEALEARSTEVQGRVLRLSEQLSDQTDTAGGLARRLERLEGRLSNTRAQLSKFPQIESALQTTRDELALMIREVDEAWQKHVHETAKMRDTEHKDLRAAVDIIEGRLTPIPELGERIKALAAEDQRLRDLITQQEQRIPPLRTGIEELQARISYVEEERPQIFRRIDELEVQMPGIYETHEETARQIQFLQEWAQRSAEKIDELRRFEDQLEKWRTAFIEEIRQGEQRRDRRLVDWEKELKEYAEHIGVWREILNRYEIEHQDHRRAVSKIDVIAQQLEQAQAEVAEQQRLADERLQRELAAWQVENDKRWRLFLKQRDYDWEEQVKLDVKQSERLDELEGGLAAHIAALPAEFERLDENDRRIFSRVLSLLDYLDVTLQAHVAERKAQRERLEAEFTTLEDVVQNRKASNKSSRQPGASGRET